MTMDDVLAKTAITLLVVFGAAAATFTLMPLNLVFPVMIVGGLGAFVVSLIVSFRHKIPVAGVLLYSALEGLFIGGISKYFEVTWPGIVVSAVLATFVPPPWPPTSSSTSASPPSSARWSPSQPWLSRAFSW